MRLSLLLVCWCGISLSAAERINHEGRILGPVPTVAGPTLFNTAQADAVVAAMQIMPTDSPWNEDVSGLPLLNTGFSDSASMIFQIASPLPLADKVLNAFQEMNFVLVPEGQANVPITFVTYPGESDPSPYPIPTNLPIETFPTGTGSLTLSQWQMDVTSIGGDRHALIVKPFSGGLWETWQTKLVGSAWQASNGAFFNLNSNVLRTDGFTSGDAAGLPMFPGLVRFDEVQRGEIEHAMRLVVVHTREEHLYPATHHTTGFLSANIPAMGERLRLNAAFVIPTGWSAASKAVAVALQKYGCIVADNGSFFQISVTPDDRWPVGCFNDLKTISINQFEVVQSTGPTGGPRSTATAKPTADAGPDQVIPPSTITLAGSATGTGTTVTWSVYPGAPGTVVFSNANFVTGTATFTTPGVYTLLLKVADAVHTPAYDAVVVTVSGGGVNPVPTMTSLSPSSAVAGAAGFLMTIQGANFAMGNATVSWSGQAALSPNPGMTSTQMVVTVPAAYIASGGVPAVAVINGIPVGGTSASAPFIISAPASGSGGSGSGDAEGGGGCGSGAGLALAALALLVVRLWR